MAQKSKFKDRDACKSTTPFFWFSTLQGCGCSRIQIRTWKWTNPISIPKYFLLIKTLRIARSFFLFPFQSESYSLDTGYSSGSQPAVQGPLGGYEQVSGGSTEQGQRWTCWGPGKKAIAPPVGPRSPTTWGWSLSNLGRRACGMGPQAVTLLATL